MTTTDANFLRMLGDLDWLLMTILDPLLKDVGMGREHWHVLRLLEDGQGRSMGEIAGAAGLPGATATRVVDALVANTLVYRRQDPCDRRRVLVHLSDSGEVALGRIQEDFHERVESVLDVTADGGIELAEVLAAGRRAATSLDARPRADRRRSETDPARLD